MASGSSLLRQTWTSFSKPSLGSFCHFYKRSFSANSGIRHAIVVGPRRLTFGKKTDLELLMKHMKLKRHEKFIKILPSSFCVELLANDCDDMDYKMVRSRQPFFLYYRLELLLQRVKFMEEMKLTPLQKRRSIERYPPAMMISFTSGGFSAFYLRGLILSGEVKNDPNEFVNFLYQCRPRLRSHSFKIEENLSFICQELGITNECALRMSINMPCFLLWNVDKAAERFRVMHRDSGLPLGYNLDFHTAAVFPPMINVSFKINHGLLTNKPNPRLADELEFFGMSDILNYNFTLGKSPSGKPEDLSWFLMEGSRAEGTNQNSSL